jgi:hypothetical protein
LAGFAQWCRWVRDPLVALECRDPVERVSEAKQRDSRRQSLVEVFQLWWEKHRDKAVKAAELNDEVKSLVDPHARGRQYLASKLGNLAGTRIAGFVLERQSAAGKWGTATYCLQQTYNEEPHRNHRGHRGADDARGGKVPQ